MPSDVYKRQIFSNSKRMKLINTIRAFIKQTCILLTFQPVSYTHLDVYKRQPDKEDVRVGVITYKIAAHAADLAKGH